MPNHMLAASAAALVLLSIGASVAHEAHNPLLHAVKAANDRFADVTVAAAEGYVSMPCVSSPTGGAMGIHMVNPAFIEDGVVDVAKPEGLMYEPRPDGSLELLGVEFITFTGPATLNGHLFNFVNAPNRYGLDPFYEMHVWAWRENPSGAFADFNPKASCDAMQGDAQMAH